MKQDSTQNWLHCIFSIDLVIRMWFDRGMKYLIAQRHLIRQNLLSIIAIALFCYFSFHIMMGERSYLRLVSIEHKIEKLGTEYAALSAQRQALEDRVVRMRPASLDVDLLEERARDILGYSRADEEIILWS